MDELDDTWFRMLTEAGEKAALDGRGDVASYLRLKATNDMIRSGGVRWLLEAFVRTGFEIEPRRLLVERREGHTFPHASATMAGTLLTFRLGVRCLSVEAGWARTPAHGIMRGGALARANVLHFGRKRYDEELRLVHNADLPEWVGGSGTIFKAGDAERHIRLLLDD